MPEPVSDPSVLVTGLLLFIVIGIGMVLGPLIAGRFVRASVSHPEKGEPYECGEPAIGSSWVQFDLRFYVVALVFLIFDVEAVFLFPWALVFLKSTPAVFYEMMIFIGILFFGVVYGWRKGVLQWR